MSEPDDLELDAITVLGEHLINSILAEEPLDTIKQIIESGAPLWYQNDLEGMYPRRIVLGPRTRCLHSRGARDFMFTRGCLYPKSRAGEIAH
jgi:hypothetical protein